MWIGNFSTLDEVGQGYDLTVIWYGKERTLKVEDSCKHISKSTMCSIINWPKKCNRKLIWYVNVLGEPNVQARAMPPCALVNQDFKMIRLVTQANIQPNSKDIIGEKSTTWSCDQAPQEINTYKSFGVVVNGSKLYFKFASDFPSMGHKLSSCTSNFMCGRRQYQISWVLKSWLGFGQCTH